MEHPNEICAICGKSKNQVLHLMQGVYGYVCDQCIEEGHEMLSEYAEQERRLREHGWSLFSGDSRPVLIFKTKEEAMTYVRSDKCNYVQIAVPTFWIKEISDEDHQKKRKYCDEFDDDLTIRHNNKWYEGEFITEPWDVYIFNNHGDIKIMSKKSLLRLMDECNVNIEIRE